ncbi:MAG: hypothetical protein JNL02_10070, partial [Saprospiraceae bacterium]|nr:hypothetical protein [Saprospiraceae bacterium]
MNTIHDRRRLFKKVLHSNLKAKEALIWSSHLWRLFLGLHLKHMIILPLFLLAQLSFASGFFSNMNSPYFFKTRFSALYYHCNVVRWAVLFTFFAVWYSPAMLFTQTPAYLHFDIRDGLPSNLIYCAYQDKKGIMWFGTNNGLASYDGLRFHVYGTKDGLPDPEVLGLWEDSKERLWVANFRHKPCY